MGFWSNSKIDHCPKSVNNIHNRLELGVGFGVFVALVKVTPPSTQKMKNSEMKLRLNYSHKNNNNRAIAIVKLFILSQFDLKNLLKKKKWLSKRKKKKEKKKKPQKYCAVIFGRKKFADGILTFSKSLTLARKQRCFQIVSRLFVFGIVICFKS